MDNKDFYYIKGDNKIGPLTLKELKALELSNDILVWYDEIDDWTEIKDIPELYSVLRNKTSPPPLPKIVKYTKTESGELKIRTEKIPNETFEKIKPSQNSLRIFLIWSGIHIFALITSYSEIDIFSNSSPRKDKFWPFVEFVEQNRNWVWTSQPNPGQYAVGNNGYWNETHEFNGLFYHYDWSEFLIFVGGALLVFIISRLSNKIEPIQEE